MVHAGKNIYGGQEHYGGPPSPLLTTLPFLLSDTLEYSPWVTVGVLPLHLLCIPWTENVDFESGVYIVKVRYEHLKIYIHASGNTGILVSSYMPMSSVYDIMLDHAYHRKCPAACTGGR